MQDGAIKMKWDRGQIIAGIILAAILLSLVVLLAAAFYGNRTVSSSELRAELSNLPAPLRDRTISYLRTSHESFVDFYSPGDRLTWNRLRKAKHAARIGIEDDAAYVHEISARAEREALLNDIATENQKGLKLIK